MAEKKSDKKMPPWLKGKYTDAKDKKKDAEMTKGMSPKEKAEFKKKDEAHKKPKTMAEDKKKDAKIIKEVKKKSCSCGKCADCKKKKSASKK
jgi:hypothetical protein